LGVDGTAVAVLPVARRPDRRACRPPDQTWHRAAQPAAVITQGHPPSRPHSWQRSEARDADDNQAVSAPAGAGHGGGARSLPGRWSRLPTEPRRVTRPPRPAGGCARAPTSCSALVAGRRPTGFGSGRSPPSPGQTHRRNQTSIMVSRRPRPLRQARVFRLLPSPGGPHGRASGAPVPSAHLERSLVLMTGLWDGLRVSQRR
jgi:hypothetical protein